MMLMLIYSTFILIFFFNDTATTEIYTLSLHDALPICGGMRPWAPRCKSVARPEGGAQLVDGGRVQGLRTTDRKSTRLNSSHSQISYAVFCLKKKKIHIETDHYVHYVLASIVCSSVIDD